MFKFIEHWKSISVWRRAVYVSLLGTFLWFLYGAINIIILIVNNKNSTYPCGITIAKPCGLSEYVFKSETSVVFYVSIVLVMVGLLIITNIIALLFYLKQDSLASKKEAFAKLNQKGVAIAKKKGIKENELQHIIERVRKRSK